MNMIERSVALIGLVLLSSAAFASEYRQVDWHMDTVLTVEQREFHHVGVQSCVPYCSGVASTVESLSVSYSIWLDASWIDSGRAYSSAIVEMDVVLVANGVERQAQRSWSCRAERDTTRSCFGSWPSGYA